MKYNPGVCNIGRNEIRKRYVIGVFGFVFSALIIYIFISLSLNRLYFLLSFIPLFMGFEGFYQKAISISAQGSPLLEYTI